MIRRVWKELRVDTLASAGRRRRIASTRRPASPTARRSRARTTRTSRSAACFCRASCGRTWRRSTRSRAAPTTSPTSPAYEGRRDRGARPLGGAAPPLLPRRGRPPGVRRARRDGAALRSADPRRSPTCCRRSAWTCRRGATRPSAISWPTSSARRGRSAASCSTSSARATPSGSATPTSCRRRWR